MSGRSLQGLLSRSAAQAPGSPALIAPERTLTYAALEGASNRLASRLHAAGVRRGDRVGIDLEKSAAAVVAIFGILKAGAAYVPIDPKAPAARAAFIVEDCRMAALVTTPARRERLAAHLQSPAPEAFFADEDAFWAESAEAPALEADAADLAYILYTSGSTGQPKGVMLSHRAALAFVDWAIERFALGPSDRLANHAPLHFDLSILDLFGALGAGASVALVPGAASVFPRSLADWIERSGISVWYSVPSALVQLALHGALERHRFAALRLVLFAGEVFPVRHLRALMTLLPRAQYFNLYGPTETNVCTFHAVAAKPGEDDAPLPIGRACCGDEVFLHDGELHVAGPTLMDGYWGRDSAAALFDDPRPGRSGRVYRTGDLASVDASGEYRYLGRRDQQVKSRGYRIELGDIEAVLHRHPAVEDAAVLAIPHEELGNTLRAVVVLRQPAPPGAREALAALCAEQLPPYMVPGEFDFRESLPKTANGKLDRRALAGL